MADPEEPKTVHFTVDEYEAELTKRWASAQAAGKRALASELNGIVRGTLASGLQFDGLGVHVDAKTSQLALKKVMDEIGKWVR